MLDSKQKHIKRAQKEKNLFRELSQFFLQISLDDSRLKDLSLSYVKLSPDKSNCSIYFNTLSGVEGYQNVFHILILYKPSLRSAISKKINSRKTPELTFKYDKRFERQQSLEKALASLKDEQQL